MKTLEDEVYTLVDFNNRLAHIEQKIDGLTIMLKEILKKGEK